MNSSICVDASFLLRPLLYGPDSATAFDYLEQWQQENIQLIAPTLMAFEVVSTIRRHVYLGHITAQHGDTALKKFHALNIRFVYNPTLLILAWQFAKQFNRPRTYDTSYLALAHLRRCPFWTADKRLFNAVHKDISWIHCLGLRQKTHTPHN